MSERHLATSNQQMLFANLPVRKALGHFQPAGASCKSACQKGSWPHSTSRCFLQICMSERQLATFYQPVLFANLHVRSAYWQLATFNQQVNQFALKRSKMLFGHIQPTLPFYMQKHTWSLSSIEAFCNFEHGQKGK